MLAGGLKYKTQKFNEKVSDVSSSMLLFAVLGLCIPALFTHTVDPSLLNTRYEGLSLFVAVIMIIIYALSLLFSFSTHKHLYAISPTEDLNHQAKWSLPKALLILLLSTVVIAIESEFLVSGIEPITESLGWSEFFVGIILIPIIGNAADIVQPLQWLLKIKWTLHLRLLLDQVYRLFYLLRPFLSF